MAESTPSLSRRLAAETFGTFLLVFGVVGVALWYPDSDVKPLVVGLAVGIAVLAGAYAVGHISGGHFNPAVTLGAALAGRTPWGRVLPYWLAQVVGGGIATTVLLVVARSNPNLDAAATETFFQGASNSFGTTSPAGFGLVGVLLLEAIVTGIFVAVILGVTAPDAFPSLAAPAIGLTLATGLLILTPVSNGSMNPARSLASAFFAGGTAMGQVWVFWVAPLLGAAVAGLLYALFRPVDEELELLVADEESIES